MTPQEIFFSIGNKLANAEQSQMFGKPCFKVNGKAFICFFQQEMVFKLPGEIYNESLQLSGSHLFDPSSKNRPMKEWIQIPYSHCNKWEQLAKEAMKYVSQNKL